MNFNTAQVEHITEFIMKYNEDKEFKLTAQQNYDDDLKNYLY